MAAEKGRPEAYLKRITAVAQDVVDGKGMSEKARSAMEKDVHKLEEKSIRSIAEVDESTNQRRHRAEMGM